MKCLCRSVLLTVAMFIAILAAPSDATAQSICSACGEAPAVHWLEYVEWGEVDCTGQCHWWPVLAIGDCRSAHPDDCEFSFNTVTDEVRDAIREMNVGQLRAILAQYPGKVSHRLEGRTIDVRRCDGTLFTQLALSEDLRNRLTAVGAAVATEGSSP